jgi:hypothetical protein
LVALVMELVVLVMKRPLVIPAVLVMKDLLVVLVMELLVALVMELLVVLVMELLVSPVMKLDTMLHQATTLPHHHQQLFNHIQLMLKDYFKIAIHK